MKLLGKTSMDFGVIDQQLIKFSICGRYWKKNGSIMVRYISNLYISRNLRFIKREVLYNILVEFGIPRKVAGLTKMSLNET
jgi:hypothetical protein